MHSSTQQNYADALSAYTAAIQAPALGDDITLDLKVAPHKPNWEITKLHWLYMMASPRARQTITSKLKRRMSQGWRIRLSVKMKRRWENSVWQWRIIRYPIIRISAWLRFWMQARKSVDLDRGLVDYFAGQYDVAIQAL